MATNVGRALGALVPAAVNLAPGTAGNVLRKVLEIAIDGAGRLPGAREAAAKQLQRTGDVEQARGHLPDPAADGRAVLVDHDEAVLVVERGDRHRAVVLDLLPRRDPPAGDRAATFAVIEAAFAQRRKALRSALSGWAGGAAAAEEALRAVGLDPMTRAERVDVGTFAAIAAHRG